MTQYDDVHPSRNNINDDLIKKKPEVTGFQMYFNFYTSLYSGLLYSIAACSYCSAIWILYGVDPVSYTHLDVYKRQEKH